MGPDVAGFRFVLYGDVGFKGPLLVFNFKCNFNDWRERSPFETGSLCSPRSVLAFICTASLVIMICFQDRKYNKFNSVQL